MGMDMDMKGAIHGLRSPMFYLKKANVSTGRHDFWAQESCWSRSYK